MFESIQYFSIEWNRIIREFEMKNIDVLPHPDAHCSLMDGKEIVVPIAVKLTMDVV